MLLRNLKQPQAQGYNGDSSCGVASGTHLQAKEIARLNSVYNNLLKDTGVEMYGEE
jgi:hypothetical protein